MEECFPLREENGVSGRVAERSVTYKWKYNGHMDRLFLSRGVSGDGGEKTVRLRLVYVDE
jgi:hypothetical protein